LRLEVWREIDSLRNAWAFHELPKSAGTKKGTKMTIEAAAPQQTTPEPGGETD
jgi:hypothetical protein